MLSGRRSRLALLLLVALPFAAALAGAEEVRRISIQMMVSHISQRPGPIDPKGSKLREQLQGEFPVRSLRVIERRRVVLGVDEVGGVKLPTGRWVRVRPLLLENQGALLAVDVEGKMQSDLRVRSRQPVTIGIERYQDGKLVVTLEPEF